MGRLNGRRRVLFELRTPVNAAILRPIIQAFAAEPRIHWYITRETERDDVLQVVDDYGWRDCLITRAAAQKRRWDLYVNADPWAALWLPRCAKRVNFFHGVAGKYDLDDPRGLELDYEHYDRIAFVNLDRMQRYLASNIVRPEQAVLVGYPKLDALVNGAYSGAAERRRLHLPAHKPLVLFAPTYSTASCLHLAGEEIVSTLLDRGASVIVKLHDRSLDPDERYTGGIDWRVRFTRFRGRDGFVFSECDDASPLMAAADVMVTDHSSIGFEFLVLDRPLIVYHAPDLPASARINPEKVDLLRSVADVVDSVRELGAAFQSALDNPGRLRRRRAEVVEQMFYSPGAATRRSVDMLRTLLGLPIESGTHAGVAA
jgi:hypothetical protein